MMRSHLPTVSAPRVIPPHCGTTRSRNVVSYDSKVENDSDPATARARICSSHAAPASATVLRLSRPVNAALLRLSARRSNSARASSSVSATTRS